MGELETKREDSAAQTSPAPDFSAANQPSYVHNLFLGAEGLRPGWGILIYATAFYLLQIEASALAWSHDFGASGLWSSLLEELGSFVAAAIPAVALSLVERRRWGVYGLPATRKFGKLFLAGAFWGLAAISLLLFVLGVIGDFSFGGLALHGARIARFAAFWGLMFLLVGLFEEFLARGYMQFTLARAFGFWRAALILSLGFGLSHLRNEGENWVGALAAASIGLFFCFTLRRSGNLWFAVGFHAAWDWGETFLYSVPDSGMMAPGHLLKSSLHGPAWLTGGTVGPEGSFLCLAVIVLTWVAFDRAYPAANVRVEATSSRWEPQP